MPRCAIAALFVLTCLLGFPPESFGEKEKELLKTKAISAVLTPDGKVLIASGNNNTRLVNIAAKSSQPVSKTWGVIHLSGDAKTFALVEYQRDGANATLYDVATGKEKIAFPFGDAGTLASGLSADGKTLAYGTHKDLVIADTAGGKVKHTYKAVGGQPWKDIAFSLDGKYMACGLGTKGMLFVYDTAMNKVVQELKGLPTGSFSVVQSVCFSPDSTLVAASCDEVIKVWEVKTGKEVHSLKGPRDGIFYGITLGQGGKMLVSGDKEGVVTLWDLRTGKAIDTIRVGRSVFHVTLSADSKVLSATAEGGETRVYDISAAVGK